MLKRGSRPYITVSEIGELDERGKRVLAIGYKGKREADAKRPLASLVISITQNLLDVIHWKDEKHGNEDLATIRHYFKGLKIQKRTAGGEGTK